jgi:hypothetical protein
VKTSLPILPPMQCDKGCSDCCGPVLCTDKEYEAVKRFVRSRGVRPVSQGVTCPYYQDGQCQVYDARPRICRLFGHSPRLVCSKGYNTNVSPSREREWMVGYKPTRWMHEALGTPGIVDLTKALEEDARGSRPTDSRSAAGPPA